MILLFILNLKIYEWLNFRYIEDKVFDFGLINLDKLKSKKGEKSTKHLNVLGKIVNLPFSWFINYVHKKSLIPFLKNKNKIKNSRVCWLG